MNNILVFDTCLDKMYVTLVDENNKFHSKIVTNTDNKYHSAFLISTIKTVLKENNLTLKDISGIGTNIGPGSFTGIRACTTVARIMAQQLNIPAAGISSLEIIAKLAPKDTPTAVALDARKNSVYLYIDGKIKGAVKIHDAQEMLKNKNYYIITDDKLQKIFNSESYQQKNCPLGEILAELAIKKLEKENCKWQDVKPLYIQPPPQLG